ncbi:aquaporin [Streptococcus sp. SQ9-PEA]|uniref:Aquaporin n=1 Tax=Streptococcus sciuri TaxID=2973939 RepID=A0ABT2F6S9_9STRE|nr:aquaporin [Streptococcus sciuri]MCS4488163.1 aquaporin [Streptococcus sciuri]
MHLSYLHYYPHWKETAESETILDCFSTASAICHTWSNLLGGILKTIVLVMTVIVIDSNNISPSLKAIIVGIVVFAIGFSFGGTTGYAINPTRDLGFRHSRSPINFK